MSRDELDDLSGIARYLQVALILEREIQAGKWEIGQPVPSRKQLAQRFGVAEMTAARSHTWLADRGYLVSVPGVGMVVTPSSRWKSSLRFAAQCGGVSLRSA